MSIVVQAGAIFQNSTVDATPYGSLPSDTADSLVKIGINLVATTLGPFTAPTTAGQSQNFLVQASLTETDTIPTVLPYYNPSNPALPYAGPGNNGAAQNRVRQQTVNLQIKPGSSATTGSQTTPSPDAGFVGLYVVVIANGQSTITAGNIATLATAPFIPFKLGPGMNPGFSRSGSFGPGGSLGGSGTTNWTVPAGVTRVKARVWGGGGGGGGSQASPSAASGGGGGGYTEGIYTVTPGQVIAVTSGTGGAVGVAGGANNGGSGGTSSFGSLCTSTGGTNGVGAATSAYQVSLGTFGTGTGGNVLNINGTNGQAGANIGSVGLAGAGGHSYSGAGSPPTVTTATSGMNPGGGGGGGGNGGGGGVGGYGLVILEW